MENREKNPLLIILILSLGVHGLILLILLSQVILDQGAALLAAYLKKQPNLIPTPAKQEVVWVRPVLPSVQAKKLELVDIAKPEVQKVPKQARFGGQYNSSVKKETVAPKTPKHANLNQDKSIGKGNIKKEGATKPGPPKAPKNETKTSQPTKKPASDSPLDLSLRPGDFSNILENSSFPKAKKPKKKVASKKEFKELDLSPSFDTGGGIPDRFAHDFVPNVKIGDKTYLNTQALPDVQYFMRLKRKFRLAFNPGPPLRAYFSKNPFSRSTITVSLMMEVTPQGKLHKVFVGKSSGIPSYDHAALFTVRKSSPFKRTPNKLRDKDGMLRMTWHFRTFIQ